LRRNVTLVSGFAVPINRLTLVLCDTDATRQHQPKAELGGRMASLGSASIPSCGFGVVAADTPSILVGVAQRKEGINLPVLGSAAILFDSPSGIRRDAKTDHVAVAGSQLGKRQALFC